MLELPPRKTQQPAGRLEENPLPGLRLKSRPDTRWWWPPLFGIISGILLSLAFPPVDAGPIAFVALIPLIHAFYRWKGAKAFSAAAFFGLSFFGFLLSWIRLFGMPAVVGLVLMESFLVVAVLGLIGLIAQRSKTPSIFLFPSAMLIAEFTRSHIPFGGVPWGGLGYTQHNFGVLLRVTAFGGVWAASFVVAVINTLIWATASRLRRGNLLRAFRSLAFAIFLLVLPAALPAGTSEGSRAKVAIVQGNTQEGISDARADDFDVLENHVRLTDGLPEDVSLVVWPESALDTDPFLYPEFGQPLIEVVQRKGTDFLVGAYIESGTDRFRNEVLFFDRHGDLKGRYTKQHLVPFGEYVPSRPIVEKLAGGIVKELARVGRDGIPGQTSKVFRTAAGPVGAVICYESTFPELVSSFVNRGARLIVVATNNSSFERTAASRQHVAFSQMRAAEQHMWVVHAALTGISAMVSPDGAVVQRSGLFTPAVITREIALAKGQTFYAKYGDWLPIGVLIWLFGALLGARRGSRRPDSRPVSPPEGSSAVLVVVPTYNEADNIDGLIDAVLTNLPECRLLVVDDSSPDGTGNKVRERAYADGRIDLISRDTKRGLGRAYVEAFSLGLERGYEFFVEMDADFSHDPSDIPRILNAAADAHLVIGSRYVDGGAVEGWSVVRHRLSRAGNLYARALLGFPVMDATSGFRCFRREVLEAIDLTSVKSEGYAFQIDMAYRAHQMGFHVREIPIVFRERRAGGSKMSRSIVSEALFSVAYWGLRDRVIGKRQLPS